MVIPLTPDVLLAAYRRGLFPMADPKTRAVDWYAPDPRAILPLDGFRVSRSLRRACRSGTFEVWSDRDFEGTIDGCAARRETWISPQIRAAYLALHRLGHAHSVEAWRDGALAGGLYGVHVGGAFMGESMFHRATDASKVALVALVAAMRRQGFVLLDIQFMTRHLYSFGAMEITRTEYLRRLAAALRLSPAWPSGRLPCDA